MKLGPCCKADNFIPTCGHIFQVTGGNASFDNMSSSVHQMPENRILRESGQDKRSILSNNEKGLLCSISFSRHTKSIREENMHDTWSSWFPSFYKGKTSSIPQKHLLISQYCLGSLSSPPVCQEYEARHE